MIDLKRGEGKERVTSTQIDKQFQPDDLILEI